MARYALVIGIGEYQTRSFANLSKATNDAEAVARVLEQYGDFQAVERLPKRWNPDKNGFEVARQKLTGAELRQGIKTFLIEQAANSEALIYFTGHGFTVADGFGKPKGYLAASDCLVETESDRIVKQTNGVDFIGFNDLIQESSLSSLVVLLDCCHSGNFLESSMVRQTMTAFSSQRNYYAIAACRSYEEALALKTDEHSIFTGAILKGLARENANKKGEVSGDRLFDYISSAIKATVQQPIHLGWGESVTLVAYRGEDIALEEVTKNRSNPYLGLCSFEREQERYFCGRETAIRLLLDRLSEGRFLAAIGPSGCGKSSLIKAGLLPQLMRDRIDNSSEWSIERLTPGKHPLSTLVEILERKQQQNQPLVLFIDQFEEVFTLCENEAERQSFIELMANEATNTDKKTRVIVAIRTDFLDRCAAYPEAAKLINRNQPTTYLVTPLSREGIEEAIETPAKLHGATFERGLVSQIADDVDEQPGALPLLQYALKELWRVCIEESGTGELLLTKKGYEQIGGVKGALEKQANIVYKGFVAAEQTFVRQLLIELVQLGEGTEVTRRRVRWERLEAIADSINQLRRVVGMLADRRLIVTDEQTVEVAHEALLSEWSLLRNWIEEDRENIRLRRRLEAYCREWQETFKKSDDALLTGARLAAIAEWKDKNQPKLLPEEEEFLNKSLERRDRETQELRRTNKQLKQRAIALGISFVAAIGAFVFAQYQANRFNYLYRLSEAKRLQRLADNNLDKDPMASLLLSLEIAGRGFKTEASSVFWKSLINAKEQTVLAGHTDNILRSIFSKDGRYVITVSQDKTARLWDLTKPGKVEVMINHDRPVYYSYFSDDSQKILTIGYQEKALIWNRNNLTKPILELPVPPGKLQHGCFSDDGRKVLTVGYDGMAIVWTLNQFNQIIDKKTLPENSGSIWYGTFSPRDANKILTVGENGEVRFYDLNNPKFNRIFRHKDEVNYGVFNQQKPNLILTASDDGTARVWDLDQPSNKAMIASLPQKGSVLGANFDPKNPSIIITVGEYETAYIWDISDKNNIKKLALKGHKALINHGEFAPDNSNRVLTTSYDGTARVWNLEYSKTNINLINSIILKGHREQVLWGAFNPSNPNQVITAGQDDLARIWNLKLSSNPIILAGHTDSINFASFASHGLNRLLTVSRDNTARIWDFNQPGNFKILKGHRREIYTGIFAPHNNDLVLTASADGTAKLWNIQHKVPEVVSEMRHQDQVITASFSPDGRKIITASDDETAKIWALEPSGKVNHKPIAIFKHNGRIEYAAFSPSGNLVLTISRDDKTVRVWQPQKPNQPIAVFADDTDYAEFNPKDENQVLTSGYNGIAKVWNIKNSDKILEFKGHQKRIYRASFSQNGKRILTVSEDGTARVWNSPNSYTELAGHTERIRYGMFHPHNDNLVVTASDDRTARLWNIQDPQHPIVLSGHTEPVVMSIFNPANQSIQIMTASGDKTAQVYTLESWDQLIGNAWQKASRCMSKAEQKANSLDLAMTVPINSLQLGFPKITFNQDRPFCHRN